MTILTEISEAEYVRKFGTKMAKLALVRADNAGAIEKIAAGVEGVTVFSIDEFAALAHWADEFTPTEVPSAPVIEQARRNAEARLNFLEEWQAADAEQIAELASSRAENRRATASRWLREGRVFAVPIGNRQLYPLFQLDDAGRPRPEVAEIIDALRQAGLDKWPLALWWTTPLDFLDWERPVDVFGREPKDVVKAVHADMAARA
jgi:hypothetical protein